MTKKHRNWGWVFVTPYIVGLLLFFLIPVIFSIYVSFTKYNLFNPPEFVGASQLYRAVFLIRRYGTPVGIHWF